MDSTRQHRWYPARRKKTARERREQRLRSQGRMLGCLANAFNSLYTHRGAQPTYMGTTVLQVLSQASDRINKRDTKTTRTVPQAAPTHDEPPSLPLTTVQPLLYSSVECNVDNMEVSSSWEPIPEARSTHIQAQGGCQQESSDWQVARDIHFALVQKSFHAGISINRIPSVYDQVLGCPLILPMGKEFTLSNILRIHPRLFEMIELDASNIHIKPLPYQDRDYNG